MHINEASSLFAQFPHSGEGWREVSVFEFNQLRASGWNPAELPYAVTRRQLFLWLNGMGVLRSQVRALINTETGLIEFDEAQEFRRDHPLVSQLAGALGLTSSQVDAGFQAAALL